MGLWARAGREVGDGACVTYHCVRVWPHLVFVSLICRAPFLYSAQALDISSRVLGEDHPDTASSCNNLAGVLQSLGRLDEAEPLLKRWVPCGPPPPAGARIKGCCSFVYH